MHDSKYLLSTNALPHIDVPQTPHQRLRSFRLPTGIVAAEEAIPPVEQAAAYKASEDARFRERTLTWFKIGEELEREEIALAAEAAAEEPARWPRFAAIAGGTAAAVMVLVLLL